MIDAIIIALLIIGWICYITILYSQINKSTSEISDAQELIDLQLQDIHDIKVMSKAIYEVNHGIEPTNDDINDWSEEEYDNYQTFGQQLAQSDNPQAFTMSYISKDLFKSLGLQTPSNVEKFTISDDSYQQFLQSVIRPDFTPTNCKNLSTDISTYTSYKYYQNSFKKLPIGSIIYTMFPLECVNSTDLLVTYNSYLLKYLGRDFKFTSSDYTDQQQSYTADFSNNVLMGMGQNSNQYYYDYTQQKIIENPNDNTLYWNSLGLECNTSLGSLQQTTNSTENNQTQTMDIYLTGQFNHTDSTETTTNLYYNPADFSTADYLTFSLTDDLLEKLQNLLVKIPYVGQSIDNYTNMITGFSREEATKRISVSGAYSNNFVTALQKVIEDYIWQRNTFGLNLDNLLRIQKNIIKLNQTGSNHNHYNTSGNESVEQINSLNGLYTSGDFNGMLDTINSSEKSYIFGNPNKLMTIHGNHCYYDNFKNLTDDRVIDKNILFNDNLWDYYRGLIYSWSTNAGNNDDTHNPIIESVTNPTNKDKDWYIGGSYGFNDKGIFLNNDAKKAVDQKTLPCDCDLSNDPLAYGLTGPYDAASFWNQVLGQHILRPEVNIVNWDLTYTHGNYNIKGNPTVYYPINVKDQYQQIYMYAIVGYAADFQSTRTNQWLYLNDELNSITTAQPEYTLVINKGTTSEPQYIQGIDISSGSVKLPTGEDTPFENFRDNTIYLMTDLKDENVAETYQKMYSPSGLYFDRTRNGLVYSQTDKQNGYKENL